MFLTQLINSVIPLGAYSALLLGPFGEGTSLLEETLGGTHPQDLTCMIGDSRGESEKDLKLYLDDCIRKLSKWVIRGGGCLIRHLKSHKVLSPFPLTFSNPARVESWMSSLYSLEVIFAVLRVRYPSL